MNSDNFPDAASLGAKPSSAMMILCCVLAVFIIVLKGAPIVHRERVLSVGKPSIATVIDLHTTVGGRGRVTDGFFIDFIYPEMPLKGHVSSPVEEIGFEGIQRGQKLTIHYVPGFYNDAALDDDFGYSRHLVIAGLVFAILFPLIAYVTRKKSPKGAC